MTDILLVAAGLAIGFAVAWFAKRPTSDHQADKELAASAAYAKALKEQLEAIKAEYDTVQKDNMTLREQAAGLEAQKEALDARLVEQKKEFAQSGEHLKVIFQNEATKIFETISKNFSTQSEKQIGDLLNPMRERLGEFQKTVVESFAQQGKEQHTLKNEIEKIVLQTDSLTKALRGDVKAQGNWGEIMLERILEESGLLKDVDYVTQATEMGLKGEDGGRLRPDVIVKLPDNKHIIVDSKVSLTAYERYNAEGDPLQVKEFLKSIRNHVVGLESKKYQDIDGLGTPDFVLMFMPIEGAYSLAVQSDPELHSFAWGKRIVLVCPSTLFATLRTIASLWNIERQNQNAQDIARQAGALYDKFVGFVDDLDAIGKHIERTQQSYEGALNKLSSGKGNLVGRAENLKKLGVKPSKSLPKTLLLEEDEEAA